MKQKNKKKTEIKPIKPLKDRYTNLRKEDFEEDPFIYFDKNKGEVGALVGINILQNYYMKTLKDTKEVYYFDNGVYKPNGEALIDNETKKRLKSKYKKYFGNEAIENIRASTYTDRNTLSKHLINLKNGIYDLKKDKLEYHNPDLFTITQLPIDYDLKSECPKILKFLNEVLHKENIPIIQELIGYCLYRSLPFHKAFMFIGSGRNGKSTTLNLIKTFLGNENVTSVSLQELEINRFALARLHGKLANIFPDLSDQALRNTGRFKGITGGDQLTSEKKFRDCFNFTNYSKQLYSCNKIPETQDKTKAFFSRWVILNFPYVFEGDNEDPKILEKITTEKELSGLFNWSLIGLKRLLKNGRFSYSKSSEEVEEQYERLSDSLSGFVMDCVTSNPEGTISKDFFYNKYIEYCNKNDLPKKTKNIVGRNLSRYINVIEITPMIDGKRVKCWRGINVTDVTDVTHFSNLSKSKQLSLSKGKSVTSVTSVTQTKKIPIDEIIDEIKNYQKGILHKKGHPIQYLKKKYNLTDQDIKDLTKDGEVIEYHKGFLRV